MNKLSHFLGIFCVVAIFSFFALSNGKAQVISGDLVGTVLDKTGATVPKASVEAVNTKTGAKYDTQTNDVGEYRFTNLPVGTYNVSASASNFATTTINAFEVELNKTVTLPITLDVKGIANTIEVSGTAAALDTTTAQVTNDFNSEQVANLPSATSGSGVLNLALLDAGVATSGGIGVGTGPSVGGQRPRNNNFTVEGVDNNDTSVTGPMVAVPNDAVAEFSVLQNQFSPEFGHSSGGQFNTIVKSGTNEFHGVAYEYNQNRNYDALDTLQKLAQLTTVPRFDDNRFGGALGGPIFKNKLFFFGNFEYEPHGQAGVPGNVCAPTAAGIATINATPGLSATNVSEFEKYVPAGTGAACAPIPWVNNTTIPTAGLTFTSPSYNNTKRLVTSMDYDFSSKDQLRGRYIYNNFGGIDTAATFPTFFTSTPQKFHLVAINEYHTFNPGLTNEFRLGFNRFTNNFPAGNFSYPGLDSFPNLQFNDLGFLQIGPDPSAPQYAAQNTYQVADSITWTKSVHTFTFGVEGRRLIAPSSFTQRSRGDYEYVNTLSFFQDQVPNALAERSGGNPVYEGNRSSVYWFANDNWRLRPNFTVNLGVRYEYTGIPFSETLQSLNSIASVPGLVNFAAPQAPKNDWEPKIGFAYSPGNSGRTSIRAGFSIAYDVLFDNLGLLTLPPELSVTQDCRPVGTTNCPTPFLAGGGIPPGKGGITTYPNQAAAAFATSADLPVNTKYPKALNWSLGVQHSFGKDYTVEVRYVGTRGLFLPVQTRLNAADQVTPTVFLPTYTNNVPNQAAINALPFVLGNPFTGTGIEGGAYGNGDGLVPAWENAGFVGAFVTSYQPWGASTYHGLAVQVNKRMSNGLQLVGSYTYSHTIDNSTAEVFSTVLTPRRPQDFQNFAGDRSNSALDHAHRLTLAAVYNLPYFKQGNWLRRNILGNWELDPIYTFQTGTWVTAQDGVDANLNGDSAPDRPIWNASGVPGTGSGVSPLCDSGIPASDCTLGNVTCFGIDAVDAPSCPGFGTASPVDVASHVRAYQATNPNARYIQAYFGAKANIGRNTLQLPPIDDVDVTAGKTFTLTERMKLSFYAQAFNLFNHAQWVGGNINDVAPIGFTGSERSMLEPSSTSFNTPSAVFSSNPRTLQLALKFVF